MNPEHRTPRLRGLATFLGRPRQATYFSSARSWGARRCATAGIGALGESSFSPSARTTSNIAGGSRNLFGFFLSRERNTGVLNVERVCTRSMYLHT